MKRSIIRMITAAAMLAAGAGALAQTQVATSFSYQGQVTQNGQPYTGQADVELRVFDAVTGGSQRGFTQPFNVTTEKGVFSVEYNPGFDPFLNGDQMWLEVRIRLPGGPWQTLTPRQKLTAAPFSLATRGLYMNKDGNAAIGTDAWTNPFGFNRFVTINSTNAGTAGIVCHQTSTGAGWSAGLDASGAFRFRKFGPGSNQVTVPVLQITGGSDVAEPFVIAGEPAPGMVVSIDPAKVGSLRVADGAYDRTVAGIVSGANGIDPGMVLTQEGSIADGQYPVAMTGRVWCWCDADTGGSIRAGDLLTTSSTAGHAMKVSDHAAATGATIGKAMSSLEHGRGLVLVLVNLH